MEASRISTGNVELECTRLDFKELLNQISGEFIEKFQERGLEPVSYTHLLIHEGCICIVQLQRCYVAVNGLVLREILAVFQGIDISVYSFGGKSDLFCIPQVIL